MKLVLHYWGCRKRAFKYGVQAAAPWLLSSTDLAGEATFSCFHKTHKIPL